MDTPKRKETHGDASLNWIEMDQYLRGAMLVWTQGYQGFDSYQDIWLDDQMVGWYLASLEKPRRIDSPNLDSFSWLAPFEHMLIHSNSNMLKQRDRRIHQLYVFFFPEFIIHTEPPVIII